MSKKLFRIMCLTALFLTAGWRRKRLAQAER